MYSKEQNRRVTHIIALCGIMYFFSYLARANYNAAVGNIILTEGFTKSAASLAITGSFFTYGIGQLVFGFWGDKRDPRLMIFTGLLVTSVCNLLVPLFPNVTFITAIWCVNGLAQAMLWPPLVRILSECLNEKDFKRACAHATIAGLAGAIAVYFLVPLCISLSSWKLAFFLAAGLVLLAACLWQAGSRRLPGRTTGESTSSPPPPRPDKAGAEKGAVAAGLAVVVLAAFCHGILKDGVLTWLPTLLSETYRMDSAGSILFSVALPLCSIVSIYTASLFNRLWKNELVCSLFFFGCGMTACLILLPLLNAGQAAWAFVLLAALLSGCMYGVNLMLISQLPRYFSKYGRVSTVSGLLNAFTYLGSAASTYGFAVLSERFGWRVTVACWAAVAAAGILCCAAGLHLRRRRLSAARLTPDPLPQAEQPESYIR